MAGRLCVRVLLLAGLLLLSVSAPGQDDYPRLTGRVVDTADVLPADVEESLALRLAEHEAATSDQLVVATVPSLGGRDIESYANGLFRTWALGQKEHDNGVLLLVVPADRQVRIEVGYGLEGDLTDALSSRIIRNEILPRFRDGDLPAGIEAGVAAILAAIDGSYRPVDEDEASDYLPIVFIALWAGFFIFLIIRRRLRARHPNGARRWAAPVAGTRRFGRAGGMRRGGFRGGGGSSGGGGASGRW